MWETANAYVRTLDAIRLEYWTGSDQNASDAITSERLDGSIGICRFVQFLLSN